MEYSLTDFSKDILNQIFLYLTYPEKTQLNRVCKAFDTAPDINEHINFLYLCTDVPLYKLCSEKYLIPICSQFYQQIKNPLWIKKYGLLPLIMHTTFYAKPSYMHMKIFMKALQNNDFPTIRTILIVHKSKIEIRGTIDKFPFLSEIKEINNNGIVWFLQPFLYPHKFGCNNTTTKQIYDLILQMNIKIKKPMIRYTVPCCRHGCAIEINGTKVGLSLVSASQFLNHTDINLNKQLQTILQQKGEQHSFYKIIY